jgi:hypothetical protein
MQEIAQPPPSCKIINPAGKALTATHEEKQLPVLN